MFKLNQLDTVGRWRDIPATADTLKFLLWNCIFCGG